MITLRDSEFLAGLPDCIAEQPTARALSYALKKQQEIFLDKCEDVRLYAATQNVPEKILDLMALDLRAKNYQTSYALSVKRVLIASALKRWEYLGTKAVVEDVCKDIFGDADVAEWFEYDGVAHHFKVKTSIAGATGEQADEFKKAIDSVKRLSAWLDGVELYPDNFTLSGKLAFAIYEHQEIKFYQEKE